MQIKGLKNRKKELFWFVFKAEISRMHKKVARIFFEKLRDVKLKTQYPFIKGFFSIEFKEQFKLRKRS